MKRGAGRKAACLSDLTDAPCTMWYPLDSGELVLFLRATCAKQLECRAGAEQQQMCCTDTGKTSTEQVKRDFSVDQMHPTHIAFDTAQKGTENHWTEPNPVRKDQA